MRYILIAFLLTAVVNTTLAEDPMALLRKARQKFQDNGSIRYRYVGLWPNPVGEVDTTAGVSWFSRHENVAYGYDYIIRSKGSDIIYLDNAFRQILHDERTVLLYVNEDAGKMKAMVTGSTPLEFSPLELLGKAWEHRKDTTLQHTTMGHYLFVEMDTVFGPNAVRIEGHMFINSSTALPERYERRVYGNGKVGQVIVFLFSGYALEKKPAALAYTLPDGYKSEMFDKRGSHVTLKEGTAAPSFQVKDIQGNTISLESLRGKKVLLDFSIMGCGYCKMALDHFSRDGFRLPENVVGVYISPTDKGSTMLKYTQQTKIPFPVVAGAKDVGSLYSVYAYPTFYLIDENGMIEKVVVGYDKEFIEGLSMP